MIKFENKLNGRFYYLEVRKDLLNDLVLCVVFGGVNVVRHRIIMCDSRERIQKTIERIYRKRIKRGYVLVS